jgi:hypothetical protein
MAAAEQEEKLREATRQIEDVVGQRVTFFRAPAFKISGATLRGLEELEYEADLSVNSQRLGPLSSDMWNVGWMMAPRGPYHPDRQCPWRRGTLRLWEIPLSCMLLPFMSNTGQALGLRLMRALFRIFYAEGRRFNRPIVHVLHPEDLCADRAKPEPPAVGWGDLLPTRDQGIRIRRLLCETDPRRVAHGSRSLLDYMRGFPLVRFMTVPEYVHALSKATDPVTS